MASRIAVKSAMAGVSPFEASKGKMELKGRPMDAEFEVERITLLISTPPGLQNKSEASRCLEYNDLLCINLRAICKGSLRWGEAGVPMKTSFFTSCPGTGTGFREGMTLNRKRPRAWGLLIRSRSFLGVMR